MRFERPSLEAFTPEARKALENGANYADVVTTIPFAHRSWVDPSDVIDRTTLVPKNPDASRREAPSVKEADTRPGAAIDLKVPEEPSVAAVQRYANRIGAARAAIAAGDGDRVRRHLGTTDPGLRGWEYHYLLHASTQLGRNRPRSPQVCSAVEVAPAIAFAGDGRLFVAGDEGTIAWDPGLNNSPVVFSGAGRRCIAVSADGTTVVTGGYDARFQVWNTATGKRVAVHTWHNSTGTAAGASETRDRLAVAISPDGRQVVSAAHTSSPYERDVRPQVHVWSAESGKIIHRLDLTDYKSQWGIRCVAFSPDGKLIATGGSRLHGHPDTLRIWDADTGRQMRAIRAHGNQSVDDLAFSPDGRRIVTAAEERSVVVWDVETGDELVRVRGLEYHVRVAFSPDGRRIVTSDWSKRIRFWDTQTGVEVFSIDGMPSYVSSMSFSPDGSRFAAGVEKPMVWDTSTDPFPAFDPERDETPDQRNARKSAEAASAIRVLQNALFFHSVDAGGYPDPDVGADALKPPHIEPNRSTRDPWGNRYGYRFDPKGRAGAGEAKLWSYGADGQPGTGDEIDDTHSGVFVPKVALDGQRISLTAQCRVRERSPRTAFVTIQNDVYSIDLADDHHLGDRTWLELTGTVRDEPPEGGGNERSVGVIEIETLRILRGGPGVRPALAILNTMKEDPAGQPVMGGD